MFFPENTNHDTNTRTYGSLYEPRDPGSEGGGADGGLGGGVILVTVGSILQLDGSLRVDGGDGSGGGGGGSGGSVFITVGKFVLGDGWGEVTVMGWWSGKV